MFVFCSYVSNVSPPHIVLIAFALFTRALDAQAWRSLLHDALTLSGALFAMLVGATTFSLVFRAFGTDRWVLDAMNAMTGSAQIKALVILAFVALCPLALEAFEMIFVIAPIVAPMLVVQLGDAQQVAVLLLLVLQMSFIVPPIGYAIVMVRQQSGLVPASNAALMRALVPYLAALTIVMALVFAVPRIVHLIGKSSTLDVQTLNEEEVNRLMREMTK